MKTHILTYKGKSSETRFQEMEEEGRKKKLEDERTRLEGKVAKEIPEVTAQPYGTNGGLAVAAENKLYVLDVNEGRAREVSDRKEYISALAVCDGKLYDAGIDGKVCDTLNNLDVAQRKNIICALISHTSRVKEGDTRLYDAGYDCTVFDTLNNDVIALKNKPIFALADHDGIMYYSGYDRKVFETLSDKEIAMREFEVRALASHKGILYDAGYGRKVFDTVTGKIIAQRNRAILALVSHDGRLYDAGSDYKVFDTFSNNQVYDFGAEISAMCSLLQPLFEELWNRGKDV